MLTSESELNVSPKTASWQYLACASLVLVFITFGVYWQSVNYPFISFDDPLYVTENTNIHQGLTIDSISKAFTDPHAGFWIPLTWISFMADYELSGLNPSQYHLTNILLHCANVLLLFALIYTMTGFLWRSFMVAALLAIHPLHVESVVWITERKDVLSLFFMLLASLSYVWYARTPSFTRYLTVTILLVSGLMAKPMLITFPYLLLLIDFWPLQRFSSLSPAPPLNRPPAKQYSSLYLLVEKIPLFIICNVFSIVAFLIQHNKGVTESLSTLPLLFRIQNALVSYTKYISHTFWPDSLGLLYPLPNSYPAWEVTTSIIFLTVITFFAIRFARKYSSLTVGWLWFLGSLFPVIGIVQVGPQAYADRFTYIPNIGLYLAFSFCAGIIVEKWPKFKIPLASLIIIAFTALLLQGRTQTGYWKDNMSIYSHSLNIAQSQILHRLEGAAHLKQEQAEEAASHFESAISLDPTTYEAGLCYYNLGCIYSGQDNMLTAIKHYQEAIHIIPDHLDSQINLAIELSRVNLIDEGIDILLDVLAENPEKMEARINLGNMYYQKKDYKKAIIQYDKALELAPDLALNHYSVGVALLQYGCYDHTIEHLQKAVELKPDFKKARKFLEITRMKDQMDSGKKLPDICIE